MLVGVFEMLKFGDKPLNKHKTPANQTIYTNKKHTKNYMNISDFSYFFR